MKLSVVLLTLSSAIVLWWCAWLSNTEKYERELKDCNMTWYTLMIHPAFYDWKYICVTEEEKRTNIFRECSRSCDRAIDDNRDLSLTNSSTETLWCLKLCMWESD